MRINTVDLATGRGEAPQIVTARRSLRRTGIVGMESMNVYEQRNCLNKEKCRIGRGESSKVSRRLDLDLATVEQQWTRSIPLLYRAAARMLRNPQDSEDALQDGLLLAFRRLDQFRGQSLISTWLYSIVRNSARMQLRKRSRIHLISIPECVTEDDTQWTDNILVDSRPNPEEECARAERSQILLRCLKHLPPDYEAVVRLCMIDGLQQREAAQRLGVSVGVIKSRLHRVWPLLVRRLQARMKSRSRQRLCRTSKHASEVV